MIQKENWITTIRKVRNQAIKSILKIKVQTIFKELGYEIKL